MFNKILIANRGDKAGSLAAQPNRVDTRSVSRANLPREL